MVVMCIMVVLRTYMQKKTDNSLKSLIHGVYKLW